MRLAQQADIQRPLRMGHGLPDAAQRRIRAAHARVCVTVAGARYRHVDGEHQGGDTGGFRPLQGIAHETAVLEDVELEPHRTIDGRSDFLDRADRHRRHREGDALGRGRTGSLDFAASGVHAGQADRRQGHRHAQRFVEQLGLKAQLGHVFQHALAQGDAGQVFDVVTQRVLGVGATVGVVEQKRRQLALSCGAVVGRGRNDHEVSLRRLKGRMPGALKGARPLSL
ncbi:hypothetical protein D3C78_938120 [compost metagenome]